MSSLQQFYNADHLQSLCLTFDTDWAPDFVLEELLGTLGERGLTATIFATNPSPCLAAAARDGLIEVAIHPNFRPGSSQGGSPEEVLQQLKQWFPDSVGLRTHGLVQSSSLIRSYHRHGIAYDASLMLPDHPYLQAFSSFYRVVRIPYHWSDASHLLGQRSWDFGELMLDWPGLKILDFHPMLWYLNSQTLQGYEELKTGDTPLNHLTKHKADAYIERGYGVRWLFDSLCDLVQAQKLQTYKLSELSAAFVHENDPWSHPRGPGAYQPFRFARDARPSSADAAA